MSDEKYCVIVDALSSSRELAAEFISRGYQCIHVSSSLEKLPFYSQTYNSRDFVIEIQERRDINIIVEQLASYHIACVVAGSDSAVALADEIAKRLGLSQNDPDFSECKRNKYLMGLRLAEKGLPHIIGLQSANSSEIIAWANQHDLWPIVIKPTDGAGMEGLSICYRPDEVKNALQYLLTKQSFLGHVFQEPVVQPFVDGKEYIINTVTCNGHTYISDIWENNNFINYKNIAYDTIILMPSQGEIQKCLSEYMIKVINALDFKIGPAHSEVMLTAKGPVLVEVNARLMGLGIPNKLQELALKNTQLSLTVDAFVDPQNFAKKTTSPYEVKQNIVCVSYCVKYDNCVVNTTALELIKQLPTFKLHKFNAISPLPKTIDIATSPGWVLLIHENMDVIKNDIDRIRQIEENYLFIPKDK